MTRRLLLVLLLLLCGARLAHATPVTFVFDVTPPDAEVRVNVNGRVPADRVGAGQPYLAEAPQRLDLHATREGWAPYEEVVKAFPGPAPDGRVHLEIRMRPVSLAAWVRRYGAWAAGIAAGVALAMVAWGARRRRERRRLTHARTVQRLQEEGSADPLAGRRIGRYRIVRRIGAGGMARVYRAVPDDTLDEREAVAVKLINDETADDPTFRKRFEREIQACMRVSHPAIMRLIDWGNEEGRLLYLVAEHLEGVPLRHRIAPPGLPPEEALRYLRPLMQGLAHAHEKGLVHRDVKPENVMCCADGQVKIMDFGLAHVPVRDVTTSGHILGTPGYMAPEQIRAQAVDARADQYAVGLIAFELLTGTYPLQAADSMQLLYRHVAADPLPSVRQFNPEIEPALAEVVARMVAKVPGQRFPDMHAALDALERAVHA